MTLNDFERDAFRTMATECETIGHLGDAALFSILAKRGECTTRQYDAGMAIYRSWLAFNERPAADGGFRCEAYRLAYHA